MLCRLMTVRRRRIVFLALTLMGVLSLMVSFLAHGMEESTKGFLCGLGSALLVCGGFQYIRLRRLARDPEKLRDYEAVQKEERTVFITLRSTHMTLIVSVAAEYIGGLVLLVMGYRFTGMLLCWLVIGQAVLALLLRRYYNWKF